jgi:hypothetical protein
MFEMSNTAAKGHSCLLYRLSLLNQLVCDNVLIFYDRNRNIVIVTIVAVILAYFHVGLYFPTVRTASSGNTPLQTNSTAAVRFAVTMQQSQTHGDSLEPWFAGLTS